VPERPAPRKRKSKTRSSGDVLSRRSIERALGPRRAELLAEAGRLGAGRGWPVYLVGGVVRDLLLDRSTNDLDLVVVGNARSLARDLARRHHATYREHRAFGTAAVVFDDGLLVDLATSRREVYAHPAALPRVEPCDLHADLRRRDFTINGIALNLAPRRFGALIDPLGGRADLRDRTLRVLHERSFIDDPTRALRAIRFAVRLGFAIEPDTADLIRVAVRADLFSALSPARLRREVELLFEESAWDQIARSLRRHFLWAAIDPALRPSPGEIESLRRLEEWAAWYAGLGHYEEVRRWVLALSWLTRRWSERERAGLATRLRPDRRSSSALFGAADQGLEILAAVRRAPHRPSRVLDACHGRSATSVLLALAGTREGWPRRALRDYLACWRTVRADIRGSDLLCAGIRPGPAVAVGLDEALRAKLDGRAESRREQLEIALRAAHGA